VTAAIEKSAAFVPEMAGLAVKLRGAVPVFVSVAVMAALVVP